MHPNFVDIMPASKNRYDFIRICANDEFMTEIDRKSEEFQVLAGQLNDAMSTFVATIWITQRLFNEPQTSLGCL